MPPADRPARRPPGAASACASATTTSRAGRPRRHSASTKSAERSSAPFPAGAPCRRAEQIRTLEQDVAALRIQLADVTAERDRLAWAVRTLRARIESADELAGALIERQAVAQRAVDLAGLRGGDEQRAIDLAEMMGEAA